MRLLALALALASFASAQCTPDGRGICVTGLTAIQDNLLGPLTPYGSSPWTYSDLAEKGTADNMVPAALGEAPTLGSALSGTVSWSTANNIVTTTADLRTPLSGQNYVVFAWNTIDGAGTGRAICAISAVSATQITCNANLFEPTSSGVTAYLMPPPDIHGWDFNSWTAGNPSVTWNYYDVGIGLARLWIRTANTTYQTDYRAYADITWQWVIDHGYAYPFPRAASMISQYFRALDGHPERFPGLYTWMIKTVALWANPAASPAIDNREAGYALWDIALGAKTDSDATRHAQYCAWLSTYTPTWNSVQAADGSWPENEYALNPSFVSAPKTFVAPFLFQGAPWREAINVRAMEAAYESLADTSAQGCNNPSLAASTLTAIINAVTWQNNYGRDTNNRGIYYEVNSQSDDQDTVYPGAGTVSINVGSAALVGSGTNWVTAGFCDGTHFIGFQNPRTIYKITSCVNDTNAALANNYGLYGEGSALVNSPIAFAPAAPTGCHSSATYCFGSAGDRNLTRTTCAGFAWVWAQTFVTTYKTWADECFSASLGGPTAGLTSAANIGSVSLPCAGAACDGLVADTVAAAANCGSVGNVPPCVNGSYLYSNLGKNYGEAFGAPGIDNALGWRLFSSPTSGGSTIKGKHVYNGKTIAR